MNKIGELVASVMGMAFLPLYILIVLGDLYWLWMAIRLGSFMMFLAGMFPPLFIVTCPVGAWSLLFGAPDWVMHLFG